MLFEQNEEVNIAGTVTSGKIIKAELFDIKNNLVKSAEATVLDDGTFEVSFIAPSGGFSKYKIVIFENNVAFKTLNNVVLGELWLVSGQSNMEFPLSECSTYKKEAEKALEANGSEA